MIVSFNLRFSNTRLFSSFKYGYALFVCIYGTSIDYSSYSSLFDSHNFYVNS